GGVWVIEDFVQAGLMKNPVLIGDFAITSYRKLVSIPDGAILASKIPVDSLTTSFEIEPADEAFVSAKTMAKIIRGSHGDAEEFIPLMEHAEESLNNSITPRHISWLSKWMITRLDLTKSANKRR